MTTEAAQRRLLEALAALNGQPDPDMGLASSPLRAFVVGVRWAANYAQTEGQPHTSRAYHALADLAEAVDTETKEARRG